ncbi:MAG: efflux RND transporter periplasmic adaptor subunit [Methylacidiphilales bacterium]|nr:efflux RND transporter periplasmic adaptor subunit [Candidatus Methylacidiphilales bacterium]
MKRIYLNGSWVLFLVLLILTSCSKKEETAPAGPPVVLVAEATQQNIPIFGEAIATLEGSTTTQIHSQVTGYLIKQDYTQGAQVNQGDPLFEIDPKTFQADLDKAQANLASAQASLDRSNQDLARYAALVKSGAVSVQEYQNQVQTNISAKANVDGAQASVTTAQINLGYTKITAPISGIAGNAVAQLGDLISPSTTLTTMSTVDPIKVQFTVSEQFYLNNADRLSQASAVPLEKRPASIELLLPDGTLYAHKGRFDYVDRQIQTSTGVITLYALFPNPENLLRPGQYAKIRAVTQKINDAVLIPQRAVNELQGLNQVIVIKPGNIVEVRNVELGDKVGLLWVVTAGLQPGEKVVVEGIQKCQPGEVITPEPYVPDTPSPTPDPNAAAPLNNS